MSVVIQQAILIFILYPTIIFNNYFVFIPYNNFFVKIVILMSTMCLQNFLHIVQ